MKQLESALKKYSSLKRKKSNEWFFKPEYSKDDIFIGVSVPDIRIASKQFYGKFGLNEMKNILKSPIHEVRLSGLVILNELYERNKRGVFNFYVKNAKLVNNWDLVDCSAPRIVGNYLLENQKEIGVLYKLAKSYNLWERRISIVATLPFIKKGYVDECLKISKILLVDSHDLIHKAVGWMLRESWKKKPKKVEDFIIGNYNKIPRTTLRYAIERMNNEKRKRFLKR